MMNNDATNLPEDVRDAIAAADRAMTWEAQVERAYRDTPTARLRAQLDEARLASERAVAGVILAKMRHGIPTG